MVLDAVLKRPREMRSPGAHAILWSCWRSAASSPLRSIFESWVEQGIEQENMNVMDVLLMESQWRKDSSEDKWHSLQPSSGIRPSADMQWRKMTQLVEHVDSAMERSAGPEALLVAVERFASGPGCWLKVAGGPKGAVLEMGLLSRLWRPTEVVAEFGTFVGYSAIRLARKCGGAGAIVTIEVDPVQASIARHFIDLAGLSKAVAVWIGQVRDLTPRLLEEFGAGGLGFLFMDHKGQIFHSELARVEQMGLLAHNACAVADNVASPGAPLFMWYMFHSTSWATTAWAVHEFLEPEHEDWIVVGVLMCPPHRNRQPPPPDVLLELAWHSNHLRRRSEGLRPAEGLVRHVDRQRFARMVVEQYAELGIEAAPWTEQAE
eukprot:gnl/TRDRNA2_/TRDRNA2_170687_c0_seq1.p1 gnl/TRDRNA2_/TRDRNA2_170687_c0~~gnl/TRDRNA2_/TRDRNA2_170687_c0_seq1.p1  ORF type:complete len:376 (+),score=65.02 gnl/TRDRNA2_/TRDRNA2_170687_c0_seq1:400-1527(+)